MSAGNTDGIPPVVSKFDVPALCAVLACISAGLLAFSQTAAWYGDEEYHLLAAQLINAGKRPYVDFFYNHTPLFIYLNAMWMEVFGESWRTSHALSALFTAAAVILTAQFVYSRLRPNRWALAGGVAAAIFLGLHFRVVQFGTISQAYGLCLFLIVASFRLTIAATNGRSLTLPLGAGLCAGAALASSLLTAPAAPVLLLWMVRHSRRDGRLMKLGCFVLGSAIPFGLLIWLALQAPRQVFFSVLKYPLFHRAPSFASSARWNLEVMTGWMTSTQGLLLAVLAAIGLLFLAVYPGWEEGPRAQFRLCAWMAAVMGFYLALPRATFPQYFILLAPFVAALAAVGLYAIGLRIWIHGRTVWLVLAAAGLFAAGLVKPAREQRPEYVFRWQRIENIAREVNRVTPPDGLVWADEGIYFCARRLPPRGLENSFAHELPVSLANSLHVVPRAKLNEWLASGRFQTVSSCWNDERWIDSLGLPRLYAERREVNDCYIFWNKVAR